MKGTGKQLVFLNKILEILQQLSLAARIYFYHEDLQYNSCVGPVIAERVVNAGRAIGVVTPALSL